MDLDAGGGGLRLRRLAPEFFHQRIERAEVELPVVQAHVQGWAAQRHGKHVQAVRAQAIGDGGVAGGEVGIAGPGGLYSAREPAKSQVTHLDLGGDAVRAQPTGQCLAGDDPAGFVERQ